MKIVFCLLLGLALPAYAETFEVQIEQASSQMGNFGEYRLWIPPNSRPDRILAVFGGSNQCSLEIVDDPAWQSLASSINCALLAGFYFPQGSSNRWDRASEGSGAALLAAIRNLASRSGEDQLTNAPLYLVGDSQGGQLAFSFGSWQPARTLGFVSLKGGQHDIAAIQNGIGVPGLFVAGQVDTSYRIFNIESVFSNGRAQGAPWCLAIDPGGNHSPDRCGPLVCSFLQALSRQGIRNEKALVKPDSNISKGDISSRSWFPDTAFKCDWSKFQSGGLKGSSPSLSFPSTARLTQAAVTPTSEELGSIESGQKSERFSLNVAPNDASRWDSVSVLDCSYLSEERVVKLSPRHFTIYASLNSSGLPLGRFVAGIPLRFALQGTSILGGLNVPLTATVTGDVVAAPALILLRGVPGNTELEHITISSKAKHVIQLLSCQAPAGVEVESPPISTQPLILTVSFAIPKKPPQNLTSGFLLLHLKTDREWFVRIPYIVTTSQ